MDNFAAGICLLKIDKINNYKINTRAMCEICSKISKTSEGRQRVFYAVCKRLRPIRPKISKLKFRILDFAK